MWAMHEFSVKLRITEHSPRSSEQCHYKNTGLLKICDCGKVWKNIVYFSILYRSQNCALLLENSPVVIAQIRARVRQNCNKRFFGPMHSEEKLFVAILSRSIHIMPGLKECRCTQTVILWYYNYNYNGSFSLTHILEKKLNFTGSCWCMAFHCQISRALNAKPR